VARSRNIKPGLFTNEHLAELPFETRLLFAGLPCFADREGRLEDRPKRIKMAMFPADSLDLDVMLGDLDKAGFIRRYAVGDSRYIQILKFLVHQMPHHKETTSVIPPPPGHKDSGVAANEVTRGQRQRLLDRDGHKCLICGSRDDLHVDHIMPVSKGGSSEDYNLQILCRKCNCSKGNRTSDFNNAPSLTQQRPVIDASKTSDALLVTDSLNLVTDSLREKGAPPKGSAKATRIPENWELSAELQEWTFKENPRIDIKRVLDSFTDYWRSVPAAKGRKLDWDATWRNWVRRENGNSGTNRTRESSVQRSERIERAEFAKLGITV
jgi:hypothetical protein